MDKLLVYSDSDSESEKSFASSESRRGTSDDESASRPDYFGLDCSSHSEDEWSDGKPLVLDTVINAYQLNDTVIGPRNIKGDGDVPPLRSVDNRLRKRRRLQKEERPWAEVAAASAEMPKHSSRSQPYNSSSQGSNSSVSDYPFISEQKVPAEVQPPGEMFRVHSVVAKLGAVRHASKLPRQLRGALWDHRTGTTTSSCTCVNTLSWGVTMDSCHLLLSASMDGTVKIWDALDTRMKCLWSRSGHGGAAIRCAQWCPTSKLVASGGYDKALRVFDLEKDTEVFVGTHSHFVTCLRFHDGSPHLVLSGTLGSVECWDTRQGGSVPARQFQADFNEVSYGYLASLRSGPFPFRDPNRSVGTPSLYDVFLSIQVQDVAFLPNGAEFVCCSNLVSRDSSDKAIVVWDFKTGAILSNQIFNERYHCTCLRVHPSEKWFLAQTNGDYVALFSTQRPYKMHKKKRFEGHKVEGYWVGCDVSPDGRYVYSGSANGSLYAYDFASGFLRRTFRVSAHPCLAVACHPALPSLVATSDWSGGIHVLR